MSNSVYELVVLAKSTLSEYLNANMKILCINYNSSQINTNINTIGSKICDIMQVVNFRLKSKSMTLLIIKWHKNYIVWALC